MTEIEAISYFENDLNKLKKKYRTIEDDVEHFKTALLHNLPDRLPQTYRIPLGEDFSDDPVYKVKHFRCQSIKGKGAKSGIRVIYGYNPKKDVVTLIQIYHKTQSENHDEARIKEYLKKS